MSDVYRYKSPEKFLMGKWRQKQEKNPRFSLRAWAKLLGLANHSMLQQMLAGKKKIPKKYLPKFIINLDLDPKEGLYLETLVDIQRAKSIDEKEVYLARLVDIYPNKKITFQEVEAYKYLKDPLHVLLMEMCNLPDFKADPQWIKRRIIFDVSFAQIEEAIERLISLGLLIEDQKGKLCNSSQNLSSPRDVTSKGVQEYHKNISALAAKMISIQDIREREYNSYAINIKKSSLPIAKKAIRNFIDTFAQQVEAKPQDAEETYQLNIQFFALTKKEHRL